MEIFSCILAIVVLLLFIWSLVFTKKDSAARDAILAITSVFALSMCTADACLTSSKGFKICCIILSCLYILVLCIYILRLSKFDKKIKDLIENNSEVIIEKFAEYMSNGPSLRVDINSDADISYEILEKVRDELRKNSSIKIVMIHYEKELENKEIEGLLSNIFNGGFHPFFLLLKKPHLNFSLLFLHINQTYFSFPHINMYKKFTIGQLSTIQNNVIPHLYSVILKESGGNEKDFIGVNAFFSKVAFREGTDILYFDKNGREPLMRIQLIDNIIALTDEIDSIQIQVPMDNKSELNSLVNRFISKKGKQIGQKTIEQLLMDYFVEGKFYSILGKPYLVYDIETALISGEVSEQNYPEYYLGFSLEEVQPGKMQYNCIMKEDLSDFVNKMINFDGYIIGFNQLYFDNPVSVYNAGLSKEELKIIDEKSLDLYVFFQQLTGRRMGLNKISDSLIGVTKTLDSGADVENLWKERKTTNDNKILKTVQEYCKNDVRMTALVMLYLLQFKKVDLDDKEFIFDIPEFLELSRPQEKKSTNRTIQNTSLF